MLDALRDGRTDLVFELVARGTSATETDRDGVSLLAWCAYYGDVSAIRFLESHGARLETLGDGLGLNGAAFHGYWRLCQFLIERGADPNQSLADTGETPLHAALCKTERPAHERVVEVLLAAGADPNHATIPGIVTGSFHRDARTRGETPLHRAAACATPRVIEMLLARSASREARDVHGDSPLAWASWHRRPAHVLELLLFGEHRIHPAAVETARELPHLGRADAMELHLLGRPRT